MKCPQCNTQMKALFTSEFCPNDCDRPQKPPRMMMYFNIDAEEELHVTITKQAMLKRVWQATRVK